MEKQSYIATTEHSKLWQELKGLISFYNFNFEDEDEDEGEDYYEDEEEND